MYINITTSIILVALFNNKMRTHYLQENRYHLDAEKAYSFPPAVIYSDQIQNYYHPTDHYLVTVLDTSCPTALQIDTEVRYHEQSELSMKKIKAGYHQIFASSIDDQCQPHIDRWIYNQTEQIEVKEYK